jgi:hypothetical protein
MSIQIQAVDDRDMPALFDIASSTYGYVPAWRVLNPEHLTVDGYNAGIQRYRDLLRYHPDAIWHKAVDTATGTILGFTIWTIYRNCGPGDLPTSPTPS